MTNTTPVCPTCRAPYHLERDGWRASPDCAKGHLEKDARVTVELKPGRMSASADEAEQALLPHARTLRVYQYDARIIQFLPRGGKRTYRNLSAVSMVEIFQRVCIFKDPRGNRVGCPIRLAALYLNRVSWQLPFTDLAKDEFGYRPEIPAGDPTILSS